MTRPYTICHMMTALDGKIIGDFMETPEAGALFQPYVDIQESYEPDGWICGRITMEESFAFGEKIEFEKEVVTTIPRTDFIANHTAERYMIAADPSGKLRWTDSMVPTSSQLKVASHIVIALSENVPDAYLNYLQDLGISYIFAGNDSLSMTVLVEKLHRLLGIKKMMIDGGGYLNGAFLNEGLVDELSLLLVPAADGSVSTPSLFAIPESLPKHTAARFSLNTVEKMAHDAVYLNYSLKK